MTKPRFLPVVFPSVLLIALSANAASAAAPVDYTQRINGDSAVAVYPIPYTVPQRDEIKGVLDRIKGHVDRTTTLKIFDNKTGREITEPDMTNFNPDAVIDRRYGHLNFWDYTNGVMMSAFAMIADETGDQSYLDYNVRFYDFTFTWMPYFRAMQEQTKKRNDYSRMVHMSALDHCGSITAALIRTHMKHPDPRYRAWIDTVADYITNKQFRFEDGSLARQRPQPRSLWTDDFYMGVSFLAQMGKLTGDTKYWDDGVRQITQMSKRLFIDEKGLYDHGWSENTEGYDPRFYWARANGWATMAMCELLSVLPEDFKGRADVLRLFRLHMRSLIELQDGTGLWHNMLDKSETYLETSASAMFVYGLAKGLNEGWLSPIYGPAAITGWNGLVSRVLPDGRVEGICEGTTYANDNTYYFFRGASANTTFFGSVLYAGVEMMKLVKNPGLHITPARPNAVNSAIHFKWTKDVNSTRD